MRSMTMEVQFDFSDAAFSPMGKVKRVSRERLVIAGVRKSLGHDIDFANQGDREAIGNALVQHIRQTGGCDVAGSKANGCAK